MPRAIIAGSVEVRRPYDFEGESVCFGIRLLPGRLDHFGMIAARELVGNIIDLSSITDKPDVVEKICTTGNFEQKIDEFLNAFPETSDKSELLCNRAKIVREMIAEIYRTEGNLFIQNLEQRMLYSKRHLLRVFKEFTGIDIKKFCRMVRFQAMIKKISVSDHVSLADISIFCGYYDQPHFQMEFKEFTGITPETYLRLIYKNRHQISFTLLK